MANKIDWQPDNTDTHYRAEMLGYYNGIHIFSIYRTNDKHIEESTLIKTHQFYNMFRDFHVYGNKDDFRNFDKLENLIDIAQRIVNKCVCKMNGFDIYGE